MAFNWDEQDEGEFRDIPESVYGTESPDNPVVSSATMSPKQPQRVAPPQQLVPVNQFIEEVIEAEESEEEDFEAVLADANLRIELATLYKMIMNHDLFDGTDADPRAIETVTRGIRKFAREQMEIMLGMRQEVQKESVVSSPFNDLEVDILKKLASAASKGATQAPEANRTSQVLNSPRREGLNTIGGGTNAKSRPNPVVSTKKQNPSLASKQQAPIQRQARPQAAPVIREENYKPLTKPLNEMTSAEREERNKGASLRQGGKRSVKSTTSLPMPTPDQEEMFHTNRMMNSDNPLASQGAVSAILAALNRSKQ